MATISQAAPNRHRRAAAAGTWVAVLLAAATLGTATGSRAAAAQAASARCHVVVTGTPWEHQDQHGAPVTIALDGEWDLAQQAKTRDAVDGRLRVGRTGWCSG